jgi:hypothetical protein
MGLSLFKSCVFLLTLFATLCLQAGCSVLAVADAAVSVGATVVKTGVNVVGAAVDAVLPSKDKK